MVSSTRCRCQHEQVQLWGHLTRTTVKVLQRSLRIATNAQGAFNSRRTTVTAHVPLAHREVAGWNAPTLTARTQVLGPRCAILVEWLLDERQHPQQAANVHSIPPCA